MLCQILSLQTLLRGVRWSVFFAVLMLIWTALWQPVKVAQAQSSSSSTITVGSLHSCAINDGILYCWGDNGFGQLGNRTTIGSAIPVAVHDLGQGVTAVEAGYWHTCAIRQEALYCWGDNRYGQLGDGTTINRTTPVAVLNMSSGVTAVAAGDGFTCAIKDEAVYCWGTNANGELGEGGGLLAPLPYLINGVKAITAGESHACALRYAAVYCWGRNYEGQLGNWSRARYAGPTMVEEMTMGVTAITAGRRHTCAIRDEALFCWGDNYWGQLGDGISTRVVRTVPARVLKMDSSVRAASAGFTYTAAIKRGALYWWHEYADPKRKVGKQPIEPVVMHDLKVGVKAVAAGLHTLILMAADNCLYAFGPNQSGQLGDGTQVSRPEPVLVHGWCPGPLVAPGPFSKLSPENGATSQPGKVTLRWTAASGKVHHYRYCHSDKSQCTPDMNVGTATVVEINNLKPGKTYNWQVRACADSLCKFHTDANDKTEWTFTVVEQPGRFNKIAPTNGFMDQPKDLVLNWSRSVGVHHYRYCAATTTGCTPAVSAGVGTSTELRDLTPGTTYYWQVRACADIECTIHRDASDGHWSATVAAGVERFSKAAPLQWATDVPRATAVLSWHVSPRATGYEVCVGSAPGQCEVSRGWVNVGDTTHWAVTSTLEAATTYWWQVRALVNDKPQLQANSGSWWVFTTLSDLQSAPMRFRKLAPVQGDSFQPAGRVNLSWSAAARATDYQVCVGTQVGLCDVTDGWVGVGNATSWLTSASLQPATTYWWQVRASGAKGRVQANQGVWGYFTTAANVTLAGAFSKSAPANNAHGQTVSPILNWYADQGVDADYQVCVGLLPGDCSASGGWASVEGTSYSPIGLRYATTYWWQVRMVSNEGGEAIADNGVWWRFTTETMPGVSIGAFGKGAPVKRAIGVAKNAQLTWGRASNAARYTVCVGTEPGLCDVVNHAEVPGTKVSIDLEEAQAGRTYWWQVFAYNGNGHDVRMADGGAWWAFSTANDEASGPGDFVKRHPANGTMAGDLVVPLWDAASGAVDYRLCMGTMWGLCDVVNRAVTVAVSLTVRLPAGDYWWQVIAVDGNANTAQADGGEWWLAATGRDVSGSWTQTDWAIPNKTLSLVASGSNQYFRPEGLNTYGDLEGSFGVCAGVGPWCKGPDESSGGQTLRLAGNHKSDEGNPYSSDLDGDGISELLFAASNGFIFWGQGAPNHRQWGRELLQLPAFRSSGIAVADLNGDGLPEVILVNHLDGVTYNADSFIYWGQQSISEDRVTYSLDARTALPTSGGESVAVADLNRDGRPEVIFANSRDDVTHNVESVIYWGQAGGVYGVKYGVDARTTLPTSGAKSVAVADLNRDGRPEVIFANSRDDVTHNVESFIYWGQVGGLYGVKYGVDARTALPTRGAESVAVADLNRDGRPEVIFANSRDDVTHNVDSFIYWGQAGGLQGVQYSTTVSTSLAGFGAHGSAVADLNGDGRHDVALQNPYLGFARIFWGPTGQTSGAEMPMWSLTMPPGFRSLSLSDLNNDGRVDLITSRQGELYHGLIWRVYFHSGDTSTPYNETFSRSFELPLTTHGSGAYVSFGLGRGTNGDKFSQPRSVYGTAFPNYGVLESMVIDSGQVGTEWQLVVANTTIASGTGIELFVAASNDLNELGVPVWQSVGAMGNGHWMRSLSAVKGRYARYKVVLWRDRNTEASPALHDITLNYKHKSSSKQRPGSFSKLMPLHTATDVPTEPILSWMPAGDATYYEICYDANVNGSCGGTWLNVGDITLVTLYGLSPGTNFEWQVRACNINGCNGGADRGAWWVFRTANQMPTAISAYEAKCMLKGGSAYCWDGDESELEGPEFWHSFPVEVYNLGFGVTSVSVHKENVCAIKRGQLFCWGSTRYGMLGDGRVGGDRAPYEVHPIPVPGMETGVTAVAVGMRHSCAVKYGQVYCWGQVPLLNVQATPQPVGLTDVITVAVGFNHSCAIKRNGALYCWGSNALFQLGDGTRVDAIEPRLVPGFDRGVTDVSITLLSLIKTCVIKDEALYCWWSGLPSQRIPHVQSGFVNSVKAGAGIAISSFSPLSRYRFRLFCEFDFYCAVKKDGELYCSADHLNEKGFVHPCEGPFARYTYFVKISGLQGGIKSIAGGKDFVLIQKEDNCLYMLQPHVMEIPPDPPDEDFDEDRYEDLYDEPEPLIKIPNSCEKKKKLLESPGPFTKLAPASETTGLPGNVILSWSAASGNVHHYRYCNGKKSECTPDQIVGLDTSVMLKGLTPGTTYYWQVTACGDPGCTLYKNADNGPWSYTVLAKPGSFSKTSPSNRGVGSLAQPVLIWREATGVHHYRYCVSVRAGCMPLEGVGRATSVLLRGLMPGVTYYWQVRACADADCTIFTDASGGHWQFLTLTPPGQFEKTAPANQATVSVTLVTLSWRPATGVHHYRYCVSTTRNCQPSPGLRAGTATSVPLLMPLTPGTTYHWQVWACVDADCTFFTEANDGHWSFTTATQPGAFDKVAPGNGAVDQPGNLTLSWRAASRATSYEICVGRVAHACDGLPASSWLNVGNALTYTPAHLEPGRTYYWQVRAVNGGGSTVADSGYWRFSTRNANSTTGFRKAAPAYLTTVAPTATVVLSWYASMGASGYEVCVGRQAVLCDVTGGWVNVGDVTQWTPPALESGVTYWWQVRALGDEAGDADAGEWWMFVAGETGDVGADRLGEMRKQVTPTAVRMGELITYTIVLSNATSEAITIAVSDTLAVSATLVSATPGYVQTGQVIVWHDVTVPVGGATTLTVTVKAASGPLTAGYALNSSTLISTADRQIERSAPAVSVRPWTLFIPSIVSQQP